MQRLDLSNHLEEKVKKVARLDECYSLGCVQFGEGFKLRRESMLSSVKES